MPTVNILKSIPVMRSARVAQVEGIFDIAPSNNSGETWSANIPLDEREWNIGLIVGPSGCGKSTIAEELFGERIFRGYDWDNNKSVLDGFPENMSIKEITEILSSVGFSSPPLWLRPFRVLSTGQKMRVNVARLIADDSPIAVMDEFTSVVDRIVAQIGSAAISKAVRRKNKRFVAVTCHFDVADWLQPDWIYQPHTNQFGWRSLQRRPAIELEISRVHYSAWELFRKYHYLDHSFNKAARAFVAFYKGEPVAFQAVIATPHARVKNLYRGHRAVCLPDFQGVGIGNALITHVASAYRGIGARILSTTASPSLVESRKRDIRWKCIKPPRMANSFGGSTRIKTSWIPATNRLTSTWEYIGEAMSESNARKLIHGK